MLDRQLERFLKIRSSGRTMEELRKVSESGVSRLKVERGGGGAKAFRVCTENGEFLLHSRRDPEGEADRQLMEWRRRLKGSFGGLVVVAGFGGAHHVKAIMEAAKPGATVMVVDPMPDVFLKAASELDLDGLVLDGVELHFSISGDTEHIVKDFEAKLAGRASFAPSLFVHPACQRAFPKEYGRLLEGLRRAARLHFMNSTTLSQICGEWTENALTNLPLALELPMIDSLAGLFSGSSAIIAGAGPSLDKAIPWMREASASAPVIAVGTALKSLVASGIKPDFVVAVDSDIRIASQFEGVDPSSYWLLSSHQMIPSLLERNKGRLFLFSTSLVEGVNRLLKSFDGLPAGLRTAGTVAFSAVEAARFLGCRRIVLAGLDLAMSPEGLTHASNSVYHGCRLESSKLCEVPGNFGGNVLTTRQFALYVDMFNDYFPSIAAEGCEIWNTAEGGAAFKGSSFVRPEKMPELCAGPGIAHIRDSMSRIWKDGERPDSKAFPDSLRRALAELRSLERLAGNACEACRIIFNSEESASHSGILLAELDKLDKAIRTDNLAYGLANEALQPMLINMGTESDIASGDEKVDIGRTAERNLGFYSGLMKATRWVSERLESALRRTERGGPS